MKRLSALSILMAAIFIWQACSKKDDPAQVPLPKADFTFDIPVAGLIPTVVNFTSTSTNATSYQWTFDDGNTATGATATNTFATAKTYNVKLVVTGAGGKDSVTKQVVVTQNKPKPDFTFNIKNNGSLPDTVVFTNTSTGAATYLWSFDNGDTSTSVSPTVIYTTAKTFNVKLVAINMAGRDSVTKQVVLTVNKPKAIFTYSILNPNSLPLNITTTSTSTNASTYAYTFGDGGTSATASSPHTYTVGGVYTIKLVVTNSAGSDSATQIIRVSPYLQAYTSFDGKSYNLYMWEGATVALLMRTPNLDPTTMFKWVKNMDACYNYYKSATGQEPSKYMNVTYINNHTTIADVASTCGAGCGYLGTTGIETQNTYTDRMYSFALQNQYDQELFYEFGRNFWFYNTQLTYKTNDCATTGFAIFMRFMSMDATGVTPAPFNSTNWTTFRTAYEGLVDTYTANTANTWANTLGVGTGVTNTLGLGASDLWASFLSRLAKTYGGDAFVQKIWKAAALQPTAVTTQDAVDNFIISCCSAANKNLTTQFMTTWRWPMSAAAQTKAATYPN